jgi:type VI secretion system protein ImpC
MSDRRVDVHLTVDPFEQDSSSAAERMETPFELVILGDFSARASRGEVRADLDSVRRIRVDRDDLDAVMARVAPRVRIRFDASTPAMEVRLRELDDFHPDALRARSPLFEGLRHLRRRATDPAQLRAVAAELGLPDAAEASGAAAPPEHEANVLDRILARAQPERGEEAALADLSRAGMDQLIRRLVRPHLEPRGDPRQAEVLASIDAAVAAGMRLVLHHPAFQEVEALWRALQLLVRRVDTGPLLHVDIVDVTRSELEADLARDDPAQGRLQRLIHSGGAAGETPPALIVAAWQFGTGDDDLALLQHLARLGAGVGAPCLTAGRPEVVGAPDTAALPEPESWDDPGAGWGDLRRLPESRYLGVAMPRFLLRQPYGEGADECDGFDFEELTDPPRHEDFLWGNPAFACAALLASNFAAAGWEMRPAAMRDLDDLPVALVRADGEVSAQPVAEVLLTESTADRMLETGVMALASIRDRDVARVVRFQSIAAPLAPLAGRWASR